MRSLRQFWSVRRINDDRVILVRLGPLRLWLARAEREWGYALEHAELSDVMDIAQVPEDVVPKELEWTATFFEDAPREFSLRPALPELPLVVKPLGSAVIPDGESATFRIVLPASLEIVVITPRHEVVLGKVPSCKLSNTWFGSPTDGELCFSLPFNAELNSRNFTPMPHHVVWPVEIRNESSEDLRFEKLCLRPSYVGLYSGDTHLWSSPVRITRESSLRGTTVHYSRTPPTDEADLMELAKPLKREDRIFSRLTFGGSFKKDTIFEK